MKRFTPDPPINLAVAAQGLSVFPRFLLKEDVPFRRLLLFSGLRPVGAFILLSNDSRGQKVQGRDREGVPADVV